MISSRQIKAARALLGWTQSDLAKASGLHMNAVNKAEIGLGEPRVSTLEKMRVACEAAGVRFRGQRGLEIKEDIFESYRFDGADFLAKWVDTALASMRSPDDETLTVTPDERLFNMSDPAQSARYYKHMKKIGFRERCITSKKYDLFVNADRSVYRWLPEEALGAITYCVYGHQTAFVNWGMQEVLVIRNRSLAATFRSQFDFLWLQAKPFEAI